MARYLTYDIETLEDVKLAKTNIQIDSEETMEYITGSSVRGAFIYKYIQEYGIKNINQGIHKEKLLKGGIKFLNAYPEYDGIRSLPFPKAYFALKEEIRGIEETKEHLNIELGLDRDLSSKYQRVRSPEFIAINRYEYIRVKVDKNSNLHINKKVKRKSKIDEKNKLFRYESIKRGQVFKGIIKVEDSSYIGEVKELFEGSYIYVGGSKGSGYGRCKITNIKMEEENPEYEIFKDKAHFNGHMYLIALSDIMYRDKLGRYKTCIDGEYIGKELGFKKKVKYKDSIIEIKNITSYNNKWNCHTPQIVGIKAGSVFKYKIDEEIDKDKLLKFIDTGIGDRKTDGFGRFVLVGSIEDMVELRFPVKEHIQEEFGALYNKLNENEKQQLGDIVNRIYKNRIKNHISNVVLSKVEHIRNSKEMSSSQWGNFKDLFSYLAILEPKEGIKKYNEYIIDIKNKSGISDEQLEKVKYGDRGLKDLFGDIIKNSTYINMFYEKTFKDVNRVRIGKITSEIDEKFAYQMNLGLLIELTRYQIRAINGGGNK